MQRPASWMAACHPVQDRCLPGVDDFAVNEQGELLMTGSAVKALGLPSSVTEKFKRVRKAGKDSEGDVQMHLVPQEVLRKFLPSLASLQAQYDQETHHGQNKPNRDTGSLGIGSAMPSAFGPPTVLQPLAGNKEKDPEKDLLIALLQEQIRKNREAPTPVLMQHCLQPTGAERDRLIAEAQEPVRQNREVCLVAAPTPPPSSSVPALCNPAAVVPKMRSKTPKAPAPKTGCVPRRTVILPPLSRLNRAQLENLAVQ